VKGKGKEVRKDDTEVTMDIHVTNIGGEQPAKIEFVGRQFTLPGAKKSRRGRGTHPHRTSKGRHRSKLVMVLLRERFMKEGFLFFNSSTTKGEVPRNKIQ